MIEDNVDIVANTTIDRATLGSTIIRKGVKLDNHIQIAHNVEIGKDTVMASQSGVAGSTKVGENCMIGGQVGILGHLNLGNKLQIQAQSGITKNLKDGAMVQGAPAFDYVKFNKSYAIFRNLPKLASTVNQLEKKSKVKKRTMSNKQKTIKKAVTLKGIGLHTGREVIMTLKPAPENHGYAFKRMDLEGEPIIEVRAEYVTTTKRGTNMEHNGVRINTSEHVLAAAVGMGVDNLLIEMNASEPPIMDGSSKYFIEAIEEAGIIEQEAEVEEYVITEVVSFKDEKTGSEIMIMPYDGYQITTMVDFGTKVLGTQNATLNNISEFKENFSKARTFSFLHELEMLLDHDLIKGGNLNNAIVYVDREPSAKTMEKLKKAFNKEDVKVQENGVLNNLELHWSNEAARHKLLDVIGDLALIGTRIKGKVIANKPGHFVNTMFAKKIAKLIKQEKHNNVPKIDLNAEPLMDINKIMEVLPHRPPFLLIDRIIELDDNHVIGMKNVTMNKDLFVGHFPDAPVMPGVLQVKAMAQCGGVLVLNSVPDPENYLTYFMKIDKVKFKRKVLPVDTLIFKCELITPIRRGIAHMQSFAYANGHIVCEAELMAQITKVK